MKGISGWLEHGAYDDASSPRITKKQYLCLRRTTPDSESSAASSATLFVFDSADDYHGYFAGGQSDSSLVRHRVDARAIFGVHELVDPAAGTRAIELEVRRHGDGVDDAGSPPLAFAACWRKHRLRQRARASLLAPTG